MTLCPPGSLAPLRLPRSRSSPPPSSDTQGSSLCLRRWGSGSPSPKCGHPQGLDRGCRLPPGKRWYLQREDRSLQPSSFRLQGKDAPGQVSVPSGDWGRSWAFPEGSRAPRARLSWVERCLPLSAGRSVGERAWCARESVVCVWVMYDSACAHSAVSECAPSACVVRTCLVGRCERACMGVHGVTA